MNLLLDTHAFLWWITDDARLSVSARSAMAAPENRLFLSAASGWEIAIKALIGKLPLPDAPDRLIPEHMARNRVESLSVTMAHALHVHSLPPHHRDPFDRLLVAQAELESLSIITVDAAISQYGVPTVW